MIEFFLCYNIYEVIILLLLIFKINLKIKINKIYLFIILEDNIMLFVL